jgi:PAS domain S-box-containing protein
MNRADIDDTVVTQLERVSALLGWAVFALGSLVLLGWAVDSPTLQAVGPGWATMKPNTAFGFMLVGSSLALTVPSRASLQWPAVQVGLAWAAVALGVLTLVQYAFAVDLGIDQLLFTTPAESNSLAPQGRMAVATAVGFVLSGLSLGLIDRPGLSGLSQGASLLTGLIALTAVLGYVYGVHALYGVWAFSSVAIHTALGLLLVTIGRVIARPREGFMAAIASDTAGGHMARRLVPFAILAPMLIGWIRDLLEEVGWVGEIGRVFATLAYVLLFTVLILRTAEALRGADVRRREAQRAQQEKQAQLTGIIDSAMDAIVMIDANQRVALFNPAAEAMFGRAAADMIGMPLDVLMPQSASATHARHVEAFGATSTMTRRMGSARPVTGLRADGTVFPIEAPLPNSRPTASATSPPSSAM